MADKKFDLGDYVEVRDRIKLFYELYGQGRLVTSEVNLISEPDGKPRVMVRAFAYRTPDDPHPGVGYSWMELPGTTSYTKGSELENTETSAWGRAIAALGILVDRSIASAQEVANKQDAGETRISARRDETPQIAGLDGLIGTVEKGKPPVDMEPRQQAEGGIAWGFALKDGNRRFQVLAKGALADVLSMVPDLAGQRVTCWGTLEMIDWRKNDKAMPPFPRLHLSRIQTPEFTLPAPDAGPDEAETVPLFEEIAV